MARRLCDVLVCAAIAIVAAASFWPDLAAAQPPGPSPQITETLCRACHADKFNAQASNPHGVLDSADWRERTRGETAPP